jgi:Na+-transporting NADH:ubiquinone oxidoreductase subunit NqrB
VILASVVAVASKFLIKSKHSNVFNPATLGLLVALFVFSAGDAWWAGINYNVLGVAVPLSLVLLISAYKARRLVTAVSFVAASIVLGTILSITYGNSVLGSLAGAVIGLNYFFGLLMIADPKTSPHKNLEQLVYGVGVAVIVAILGLFVIVYPLLISLLIGNVSYAVYKKYGHLLSKSKEIHPATAHAQSTV